MSTEIEDSLARLVDRQTKKIEELSKQRDALLEAAKLAKAYLSTMQPWQNDGDKQAYVALDVAIITTEEINHD